jgi:hypothetical protein
MLCQAVVNQSLQILQSAESVAFSSIFAKNLVKFIQYLNVSLKIPVCVIFVLEDILVVDHPAEDRIRASRDQDYERLYPFVNPVLQLIAENAIFSEEPTIAIA